MAYEGAARNPIAGTTMNLELTATSAVVTFGEWRVQKIHGTLTVNSPAVPGTECVAGTGVYDLAN
jgi:hypothetical protein